MTENMNYTLVEETEDCPKMVEVYLEQTWQNAFCYGLALEKPERDHMDPKLLMTIVGGNDSTLQALKAAIDLGSYGLSFGHGEKQLSEYKYVKQFGFCSEKGKYEKFPITVNQNRKAVIIVHDKLLGNDEYILSFDGDPAEDIRRVLGGAKFGLHILHEWKDIIFNELKARHILEEVEFYYDKALFPNAFYLYRLVLEEEAADDLISSMIQNGQLRFPKSGSGKNLAEVTDLTSYMQTYVDEMVHKVSEEVTPIHNPLTDQPHSVIKSYKRELFPVQAHVSTAVAKALKKQKSVLIQGEMSTGKSSMMTAVADVLNAMSNKKGYHAILMVPPSLTSKWPDEIKEIVPHADVRVITKTEQLIEYHTNWTNQGRPKPIKPTFFVVSFTTMRGDCSISPAVDFQYKKTSLQKETDRLPYRYGYYCPSCGKAHQVIEDTKIELNENGEDVEVQTKRTMNEEEFGTSRRLHNTKNPANAFCNNTIIVSKGNEDTPPKERICGESLWTKNVPTRYSSFAEWATYEKKIVHALKDSENKNLYKHLQQSQKEIPKKQGSPRRIATVEYIRRKMKNFFDIAIIDEIHELKSGMSAQGHALAGVVSASKKVVGGTGTLFGGKAEDIYYTLWRLFPYLMVENGYRHSEVRKWNEEYGVIETTTYNHDDKGEYSNKQSRGGNKRVEKTLPGISPFVFGKFLVQNSVLVRLKDVWPDPVELVNVPTILVDVDADVKALYNEMRWTFEREIDQREDGFKLYLPLTQTGIAFPDNPFTYPDVTMLQQDGTRDLIWSAPEFSTERLLNKEKKLQEIIKGELEEGRKSIVYVRDTGSSVEGRDVRPRLQHVLEQIGAKVEILDTSTTATNKRSEWLKKKIEKEGCDVVIVSQELVKVGLDLLCTPTLLFYQFSWSLFTINQASRRAWRIGQTEECRLYYLSYEDTFQEDMAKLIAMKNKAAGAINGDISSDGLSAMLGDEGDLQSMLIKSIKKGETLKGSTEEWVAEASDRAREILAGIGKKKQKPLSASEQLIAWAEQQIGSEATLNVLKRKASSIASNIEKGRILGFVLLNGVLEVDLIEAFGFDMIADGEILSYLTEPEKKEQAPIMNTPYQASIFELDVKETPTKKKKAPVSGQLAFDLF